MNADQDLRAPLIIAFLQRYPAELFGDECWDDVAHPATLEELQASLFRKPPTSCYTPGKMRPGGYNRSGKYLPSKWIPGKTDKRAGK